MFGLKRGIVRLVDDNAEWRVLFEKEKERLLASLKNFSVAIEHVGSTAIPSIPVKPIIDISLGVNSEVNLSSLGDVLQCLGYEERGPQGVEDRILWVFGSEDDRKFYVHLTHRGSKTWNDHIIFRDALINDKSLRDQYATLKKKLAEKFAEDRKSYTSGKHEFIEWVIQDNSK